MPPRSGWALRRPGQGHASGHGPITASGRNPARANAAQSRNISGIAPAWKCLPKRSRMTGKGPACRVLPGLPHPFRGPHGSGRRFFPISPTACASFRYGILCGGFPAYRKHAVYPARYFVLLLLFFYAVPVGHPAQESVAAERECRQKACFIFDNKIQNQ